MLIHSKKNTISKIWLLLIIVNISVACSLQKKINACGFVSDVPTKLLTEPADMPYDSTFIFIINKLKELSFIQRDIIVEAKDQLKIAAAYQLQGKNRIRYNRSLIDSFFIKNPFNLNRSWRDDYWPERDKKHFPYIFIAAHELAHLINDDNLFELTCSKANHLEKRERELRADYTAAYLLNTIGIGPSHYFVETVKKFHIDTSCYPTLDERIKMIEKGFKEAMKNTADNPVQFYHDLGPNEDDLDIYDNKYNTAREGFNYFYISKSNLPCSNNYIYTGTQSSERLNSNLIFNQPIGEKVFMSNIPHTQLYASLSNLFSVKSYSFKEDTISKDRIEELLLSSDYYVLTKDSSYFTRTKYSDEIDGYKHFYTEVPDTIKLRSLKSNEHNGLSYIDTFLVSKELIINKTNGQIVCKDENIIALKNNRESELYSDLAKSDTILFHEISTKPYDKKGNEHYDMGYSLDIDSMLKNDNKLDSTIFYNTIKIYTLESCGKHTGKITTVPNRFDCSYKFSGYLFINDLF